MGQRIKKVKRDLIRFEKGLISGLKVVFQLAGILVSTFILIYPLKQAFLFNISHLSSLSLFCHGYL